MKINPIVRYYDQTDAIECPYGTVKRIVTGGEGFSNVHVVSVTQGTEHFHEEYDETYYFLSGNGILTLDNKNFPVRPGTVAAIPAGVIHSLKSDTNDSLEFIIFGTPPMSIEDDRAKPMKP